MKRILATVSLLLIASAAAADEYLYIFVSSKGADGGSVRHRLECLDAKCTVKIKDDTRAVELSEVQKGELLAALQAETKQFVLSRDAAPADTLMKLKIKYETPRQRMAIERRVLADDPDGVTPQMRGVLKTYLDLDLSGAEPAGGDGSRVVPVPKT